MKIGPIQQYSLMDLVKINKLEKKEANTAKTMNSIVSILKEDHGIPEFRAQEQPFGAQVRLCVFQL